MTKITRSNKTIKLFIKRRGVKKRLLACKLINADAYLKGICYYKDDCGLFVIVDMPTGIPILFDNTFSNAMVRLFDSSANLWLEVKQYRKTDEYKKKIINKGGEGEEK